MKFKHYVVAAIFALTSITSSSAAEISDKDFSAAIEKFLKTDAGQEKIGEALKSYMQKQQESARKEQESRSAAQLEEQFKNPVKIDITNAPVTGPANAKVTVVAFSDFECPYCERGAQTVHEILAAYPKDVKVAFKNLPLPFHKNADPAARAALAAGKQGKFWEFHDALFANQKSLGEELYLAEAKKLGLNIEKFKKDMDSPEIKKQIEEDSAQARAAGISGTPGFAVNGVLVKGAYPFAHFKQIIDRWLAAK